MNTTPEIQEQIKAARALLDAIERGEEIQWNRCTLRSPDWVDTNAPNVLDLCSFYRAKPTPRLYTVEELVEKGIRYLYLDYKVYMVLLLSLKENSITASQLPNLPGPSHFPPSWFAERRYQWSADGKDWHNFRKEN